MNLLKEHDESYQFVEPNNKPGEEMINTLTAPQGSTIVFKNWLVDSGASDHMCNDKTIFKNLNRITCEIGVAKENEKMYAEGQGDVEFEGNFLRNVLYVPDLTENIISVHSITKNNGKVHFKNDEVLIQRENMELQGLKDNTSRLYYLNLKHKSSIITKEEGQVLDLSLKKTPVDISNEKIKESVQMDHNYDKIGKKIVNLEVEIPEEQEDPVQKKFNHKDGENETEVNTRQNLKKEKIHKLAALKEECELYKLKMEAAKMEKNYRVVNKRIYKSENKSVQTVPDKPKRISKKEKELQKLNEKESSVNIVEEGNNEVAPKKQKRERRKKNES